MGLYLKTGLFIPFILKMTGSLQVRRHQNVSLRLPVDTKININSFRLGEYGFGLNNFPVIENTTYYSARLDFRDFKPIHRCYCRH